MASLPIKPLDSAAGYLRWKESLLLRAHTLGVAYVLSEARPAVAGQEAAAKKWARDDAVCRGHILCTISDRLLPDYARFATAAELWRALARTYDVKERRSIHNFYEFFDRSTADVLLEQLAHAEALGAAAGLRDEDVAVELRSKVPLGMVSPCTRDEKVYEKVVEKIWEGARGYAAAGLDPWREEKEYEKEEYEEEAGYDYDYNYGEQNTSSRKRARRWA